MTRNRAAAAVVAGIAFVTLAACSSGGGSAAPATHEAAPVAVDAEDAPAADMGVAYGEPYAFPNGMVLTIAKPHMVDGQVQLPITVVNTGDTKLDGSMFGIGFEAIGASGDIDSAFCNGDEPYRTDTILPGRTVKWIECFDAKSAAGVAVEAITNTGTEDQAEVTVGG